MTVLYGIPNCDTVKKARNWLDKSGVTYRFHDFRKDGLEKAQLQNWLDILGADLVVNKRSTTWKKLDEKEKAAALGGNAADILIAHPTLIKRPVLEKEHLVQVGFKAEQYESLFQD